MTSYLDEMLEYLVVVLYNDAIDFFKRSKTISISITIPFLIVYSALYLLIFIHFVESLKEEIGQTQEIIELIPPFIIEGNEQVREHVYSSKGIR